MTKPQHTPGPWYSEQPSMGFGGIHQAETHELIFALAFPDKKKGDNITTEQAEANARLIAAVPCMYEALELIAYGEFRDVEPSRFLKAIARDAIKKARGQS